MRFLRMLTNSLLAGAFGAAYLTILVLQLNPDVPLLSATSAWWFVTLGMLYGVHLAVVFYVALVAREFFTMDILSPGWISVRLLAWLGAALAAIAATLMWLNVRGLSATLDETAEWRMTAGAMATTVAAFVLLAIAIAHYSFGRRGSRVGASLFLIAVVASMTLPIAARGAGSRRAPEPIQWGTATQEDPLQHGPRVRVLMLDGASLDYIWPRAAEGRLPNFSRVLDGGAAIDLATIRPTQPGPVWAAVATGMYPSANGVRSAARYYARRDRHGVDLLPDHSLSHVLVRLGFVRDVPVSAEGWGARPLWSILSDAGISAGIVRWPLTHPAPPTLGFVVTDRLHQVTNSLAEFDQATQPAAARRTLQLWLSESRPRSATESHAPAFRTDSPEHVALQRDLLYARIAHALAAEGAPRLFALRYEGLDAIGHHYTSYVQQFGARGVPEDQRRAFADVVDRYYAFIDAELGIALDEMAPGDLLIVLSAFGMQPVNPFKRALAWVVRDPMLTGTHDRAPDGFLLAYGEAVQPGRPPRGSVVDVTPTILYFLGLPVARDMDGYARADLFTRAFASDRPITFIRSYR